MLHVFVRSELWPEGKIYLEKHKNSFCVCCLYFGDSSFIKKSRRNASAATQKRSYKNGELSYKLFLQISLKLYRVYKFIHQMKELRQSSSNESISRFGYEMISKFEHVLLEQLHSFLCYYRKRVILLHSYKTRRHMKL